MDPRLQLRVQRYGWDAAADVYEASWVAQLAPAHDTLFAMARPASGERVLETAAGTGLVTRRIADAVGGSGRVLATDLSERMVATLTEAALGPAVSAELMNAEALDVPDDAYDVALCALGLMYVPDPDKAVAEMARAVRPGGRVTATVWGERRNCGWAEVFPIVDARVASEVCPMFFGTGGPGVLARAFEAAGLSEVREVRQDEVLEFASDSAVCDAVILGGPVALAAKRFDAATRAEVDAEFLASVAMYRKPDGRYLVPGEFVTVSGLKPG